MHLHFFRFSHQRGVNSYYECRCGARDVNAPSNGYSTIDFVWLNEKRPFQSVTDHCRLGAALLGIVVAALIMWAVTSAHAETVSVCSFNVQFLGSSEVRDNQALAAIVRNYDVVTIQEVIAPPTEIVAPNGDRLVADPEVTTFFQAMQQQGFSYWLSEEDTGPGSKIHNNGASTEWWVTFFKPAVVQPANDLPHGFLAADRSDNPDYDRVPYAFSFRHASGKLDFVLISVHLQPGFWSREQKRRYHELHAITKWIDSQTGPERDYIILGDCNIANERELTAILPVGYQSLNWNCRPTNTNPNGPKPYDHVFFRFIYTAEIDCKGGLVIDDIITSLAPTWMQPAPYPGKPYDHNKFRKYYTDHCPIHFHLRVLAADDD